MPDTTWAWADQAAALSEGWGLFTTDGGVIVIQRHDELEVFTDDYAAINFVHTAATHGHPLAMRAIDELDAQAKSSVPIDQDAPIDDRALVYEALRFAATSDELGQRYGHRLRALAHKVYFQP